MRGNGGVVLVMALVFLLVMTLLVWAMLSVSLLSLKAANAGQQQLQVTQLGFLQHLQHVDIVAATPLQLMAECPAQYAAWSVGSLKCELQFVSTDTYSENRHFYAGFHSLYILQDLYIPEN